MAQLSISDPANAEDSIAVGSVHKTKPHTFGISYFRRKSDRRWSSKAGLGAPGEKVISCSIHIDQGYEYEERRHMAVSTYPAPSRHFSLRILSIVETHA